MGMSKRKLSVKVAHLDQIGPEPVFHLEPRAGRPILCAHISEQS
jgi:hypothetical protein